MAFRVDIGQLGKVEKTPQGGLRVPAYLTRTGVFEYHQDDGSVVREYRPPEEVFKADALVTLKDAPTTNDHPPGSVDPENFKRFSIGHVAGEARQDGDKVSAPLVIQDADAIRAIKKGRREVSCGYHCDVEETPGVTPDGERYDRVQRNIRYNHVAIVDDGRAGSAVRLRLDSKGNSVAGENDMEFELISGVKYEVGTEPHKDACKRRDAADAAAKAEHAKLTARADAAEQELATAKTKLEQMTSPERLDRAVRARAAIVAKAAEFLGKDWKADGLSNQQIRAAVVAKVYPNLRVDGRMKDAAQQKAYVDGLFMAAINGTEQRTDSKKSDAPRVGVPVPDHLRAHPDAVRADAGGTPVSMSDRRARRDSEMEARHKKPLAMSRDKAGGGEHLPTVQSSMLETMK